MAGHDDFEDDPLPGSHAAAESLRRKQPQETSDAMLSDFDRRQADVIARKIAQYGGITSTAEHRVDHAWIRQQRERCEWWSDAGKNAVRELVRWGLLAAVILMGNAMWEYVKTQL